MIVSGPPSFPPNDDCPRLVQVVLKPKQYGVKYLVCFELPDIHTSNVSVSGTNISGTITN